MRRRQTWGESLGTGFEEGEYLSALGGIKIKLTVTSIVEGNENISGYPAGERQGYCFTPVILNFAMPMSACGCTWPRW